MQKEELEDINKFREAMGFKPLALRKMKCMRCGSDMMRYHKQAFCDKCTEKVRDYVDYVAEPSEAKRGHHGG